MKQLPAVLAVAAFLSGCAVLPREVTFIRGNVECEGLQNHFLSATKYTSIWVGKPGDPYSGSPRVTLRFPDGTQAKSDQIEAEWLRARADRSAPRRATSWWVERGWPAGTEELSLAGYHFLIHADRIVCFGIDLHTYAEPFEPELGDADGKVFLRPPLRERDLVTLLGRPDSVRKRTAGGLL